MKISCNCLNIIVEGKGEKCESMDRSLKSILGNHDFFKEDVGTLELIGITTKLESIIGICCSGPWVIHRCLNCGVYVYAYNKDAEVNTIIVNCSLATNESQMAALKKSEFYSLVFDVVVNDKEALSDTRIELRTDDELYNKLVDWIEEQKILTEEKVQAYIDEQYADLEKRKAIAHRDHLAISRIILKKKKVPPKETPVKMNKRPLKEIQASYEQTSNSAQPSECSNPNRLSFDSEGLFTLDDIEDPPTSEFAEVHFSDGSESNDENVQVPRRDGAPGHYALSLPVPVPQFVHERQQNDSNSGSPNVPTDIEASMKKLAKSVHGDTVFGELPRPRFSTHL